MQVRELLIGALRQGPIPRHIAFVMDGNRRFARSHGIETIGGHNLGFEALARVRMPLQADPQAYRSSPNLDTRSLLQVRCQGGDYLRVFDRELQAFQTRSRRSNGYGQDEAGATVSAW